MLSPIWAVVPAAGAATRFGGGKLMAALDGRPLLDHTLRSLLDAGLDAVVLVAPSDDAFTAVEAAADPRVRIVVNPDPTRGMFSSIQCGLVAVAGDPRWVVVLPGDMPFVRPRTIARVIGAAATRDDPTADDGRREQMAFVPVCDGRRGHPIVLPGDILMRLAHQPASTNLKAALLSLAVRIREIAVVDPGVIRDVDVTQDLRP